MRVIKGLILASALFAVRPSFAQNIPPTTCVSVSISSSTPTEITGNTTNVATSSDTWFVTVMNLDTSNNIYCSQDSAVTISSSHQGVPILAQAASTTPFNWFGWQIGILEAWYCKAATASVTAMVCRYR